MTWLTLPGRRQLGWESSGFDQFFAALGDSRGYKRLAEIFFMVPFNETAWLGVYESRLGITETIPIYPEQIILAVS